MVEALSECRAPIPCQSPAHHLLRKRMTVSADRDLEGLPLRDYIPASRLCTATSYVPYAAVPAVDAHVHLGRWLTNGAWAAPSVAELIEIMDTCKISAMVNLDGRWDNELEANLDRYDRAYPGRFATFCHVNWKVLADGPSACDQLAASLARSVTAGAHGLKVWKDLGLHVRDQHGLLVLPDDVRLRPLWEQAAELDVPVAIHTADPIAFFDPVDERNERLEELLRYPQSSFADRQFPRFHKLIDALEAVVAAHPRTTFIGLHVGCYAENIAWVSRMLNSYPNFYIDIAARISELGRQPRRAREFILRHPDRVLFGTDQVPPRQEIYEIYFRFLETTDEHFAYSPYEPPPQGRWNISGLHLPADVAKQVYAENAYRLLPGIRSPGE